jgi:hypothetical protein
MASKLLLCSEQAGPYPQWSHSVEDSSTALDHVRNIKLKSCLLETLVINRRLRGIKRTSTAFTVASALQTQYPSWTVIRARRQVGLWLNASHNFADISLFLTMIEFCQGFALVLQSNKMLSQRKRIHYISLGASGLLVVLSLTSLGYGGGSKFGAYYKDEESYYRNASSVRSAERVVDSLQVATASLLCLSSMSVLGFATGIHYLAKAQPRLYNVRSDQAPRHCKLSVC